MEINKVTILIKTKVTSKNELGFVSDVYRNNTHKRIKWFFGEKVTLKSARILALCIALKHAAPGDRVTVKTNDENIIKYTNRSIKNEWKVSPECGNFYITIQKILKKCSECSVKAIPLKKRLVKTTGPAVEKVDINSY